MYSHRLVSICLLLAYGIPAAVGPYWHNHQEGLSHRACNVAACAEYDSCSISTENAEASNCGAHCSCSEPNEAKRDRRIAKQAGSSPACPSVYGLHVCSDHCTICAFYAQSASFLAQCDAPASSALWAWLRGVHASAEASPLRAFSARGPPAAVPSIALQVLLCRLLDDWFRSRKVYHTLLHTGVLGLVCAFVI